MSFNHSHDDSTTIELFGRMDPLIVHDLPSAPVFIGREKELAALQDFWESGHGVISLVGLGGAGKTAVIDRFLKNVTENSAPDGLLVWSFYDDPDTNAFLQTAFAYFTGGKSAEAKGAGWFHLLKEVLGQGQRFLLVLDGLERVQRPGTDASGIYGELEDPLLRGLLVRLATAGGNSKAVITSRFPISDVEKWYGRGYQVLDIDQLPEASAIHVLRSHGVKGSEDDLRKLMAVYGRHALTLDLLGGAVARFFGSEPDQVPEINTQAPPGPELQAERLAAVLRFYEQGLEPRELDLLSRLCVFRFGVGSEALGNIFLQSDNEAVTGALSGATLEQLVDWLDDLVNAHLVYKEIHDRYTVHPAVRDHFYRLFRDPAAVHGAVSKHFMSLSNRPGIGLPTEKEALDLLEELIYHALKAGNVDEALEIYAYRMGGNEHLNTTLGEYARTFRILHAFPDAPDRSAMYHCLRAFGRFEEALKWRPQNRYILIANGKLTDLAGDSSERTQKIVRYLQGENVVIPDRTPDVPVSSSMLLLLSGRIDEALRTAQNEVKVSLFKDDLVRNELVLAEIARKGGNLKEAKEHLEESSKWVLGAGSHEHLCILHLFRSRLAIDEGNVHSAMAALEEGLQIATESNFGLFRIELLLDQASVMARMGKLEQAEELARTARSLATDPEVRYMWGAIRSMQVLAEILKKRDKIEDAKEVLEALLATQRRINHPEAVATERALRDLRTPG